MEPSPTSLDPEIFGPTQPCFACSPSHPIGFHLRFAREGDVITTRMTPGPQYQGPPGIMHGGLVMTLADEIAAWAIIGLRQRFGFTARAEARWSQPVRIGTEVLARAWITSENRRVVQVHATLAQGESECFRGEFTFVLLDEAGAAKMLGMAIPEAWKRFCR